MAINDGDDQAAIRAAITWCSYKNIPWSSVAMHAFAEYLGDPLNYDDQNKRDRIVDMKKPEIRRKVEIINNSPHWYALLKVMEARHEGD